MELGGGGGHTTELLGGRWGEGVRVCRRGVGVAGTGADAADLAAAAAAAA